jgi:tripartite-type tricarboxylate transporter receptor subunit TctC
MIITLTRRALGAALLALLTTAPAFAQQDWPTRPVTVVVPFAPGGSTDAVARILAQQLSTDLGQQFLVDNRAGAVGTLGFATVARSEPDGYTPQRYPHFSAAGMNAAAVCRIPCDRCLPGGGDGRRAAVGGRAVVGV